MGGAITGITLIAWIYMVWEARGMELSGVCKCFGLAMSAPETPPWSVREILPLSLMWVEMMVAMMLPSAAPMILTFALINRRRREQAQPYVATGIFAGAYLAVWTLFSLGAALLQWSLRSMSLLSDEMRLTNVFLGAGILMATGIFQWTTWKRQCLKHCRGPLDFLMTDWRNGPGGAWWMGIKHGSYCIGCCWLLMLLLFVAGVMNMWWVGAISIFVLAEKLWPNGEQIARISGTLLFLWGATLLALRAV